jgi:tRNA threonylcarbamoyladenosine biosynthesis protein TsaB
MILCIKTDNPTAELYLYDSDQMLRDDVWLADRTLARDLLSHIEALVKDWKTLTGIVVFEGPGSFTGLRIGITVANALADGLGIPIAGERSEDWIVDGISEIENGEDQKIVLPFYGSEPHITQPRK